ncbi:MAG: DNA gyrase inhibitor YacG [Pseudomonadota bacterium]
MTCPICKKPTEEQFRPFCSNRCAQVDLARWFSGEYAIPGEAPEDGEAPETSDPATRH